jgi:hypothetical protein
MSATRFRRIARLEKLAKPYLEWKSGIEKEWQSTLRGAAAHAAVLAFLIRYGNPQIDESLECATQRCAEAAAWKECCHEFNLHYINLQGEECRFPAHDRDSISGMGYALRHFVISSFPGADEKQKLDTVFATGPRWLLWFTFADYTAALLGLTLPDLSEVSQFSRSKQNFDLWWGLPSGAFERKPWPHGMEGEPLARTDLDLLRPAMEQPAGTMTHRELRRERATSMKSEGLQPWPALLSATILKDLNKMSQEEIVKILHRQLDYYHHPLRRFLMLASTRRRF